MDSRGHLHLLWTEHSGSTYDVLYARSTDEGRSWSAPLDIARSSLPAMDGNIAVGPDDVLHAAWLDYRSGARHVLYSRSFNSGASWESARDISGQQTDDAVTPALSVDLRNRVHLAWHTGEADEDSPIAVSYYARSTDGGDAGPDIVGKYTLDLSTWSPMEWVTDDPELDHRFPSPCIGPDGRPYVAWSDQRHGSSHETVFMKSRKHERSE